MKQTEITIIEHSDGYIEIRRSDGKCKVVTVEKYRLLRGLKSAGLILAAVLVSILFCGAAVTSEHPAKVAQAVFLFGVSAFALISAIVWSVTGGEAEKSKNNRKISKRR